MMNFLSGFSVALAPINLAYCFLGVVLGNIVGVLPGIGAIAAISILLPVTFYLAPTTAVIMLAGVYYGAQFGGSISSILLNLPGTAAHAVTSLDGHPMAKKGDPGTALLTAQICSFIGGTFGILLMVFSSPLIVQFSLAFGSSEYLATLVLGLISGATVVKGMPLKGIAMVSLGMLFGCVGLDLNSGIPRFDLGIPNLLDGLSIVAIAMGLFGVPEVMANLTKIQEAQNAISVSAKEMFASFKKLHNIVPSILRGSILGSFFGPLPGAGPTIASFMAYSVEKSISKEPEKFGEGEIKGIAAPEAANNAAAQTAFIPTMTLGIPGTPTMAIILGALMIHGISPGPLLVSENPDLFWGLVASFWIGNVMLLFLNIPLVGIWAKLVSVPRRIFFPIIITLVCTGVFGVSNSSFNIWMVLIMGILSYTLQLFGFSPAPLLIGFVLGPLAEEHLRRALLIANGDFSYLFSSTTSIVIHCITAIFLFWPIFKFIRVRASKK